MKTAVLHVLAPTFGMMAVLLTSVAFLEEIGYGWVTLTSPIA